MDWHGIIVGLFFFLPYRKYGLIKLFKNVGQQSMDGEIGCAEWVIAWSKQPGAF